VTAPLLRLEHVGRRFPNGLQALSDVCLDIAPGEFLALLGPSGCGKSTLLRLISGLDAPDEGRIAWDRPPEPGGIGFVFQEPTLLPWATAEENASLPARLRGASPADAAPAARAALHGVGLAGFEDARPAALSGGMRMRVSIARALSTSPRLLLMDEPFAALDEFTRHRLQSDLLALWRERGTTIVFVTHSIAEAAFLAGRACLMSPRPGRVARVLDGWAPLDRLSPAYADRVREATLAMHAALAPQATVAP